MTMQAGQGAQARGPLRCRACGADIAQGALRCDRCGAAQSDTTCPHCRATAGASPDAELRYVCDVCGGPRIPLGAGGARRSGSENAPLKVAEAARKSRAKWRAGAAAAGVMLPAALLLSAVIGLITGAGVGLVIALLTASPLAAGLFFSLSKAKEKGREIQPALDAAWMTAATEIAAQSPRALTPRELAASLGVDEAKAEELLAMADMQSALGGGQGPRTDALASFDQRLRVATEKAGGAGAGASAEAELEAAAEAEAAAAVEARRQSRSQ
jgi:hypothetical protein